MYICVKIWRMTANNTNDYSNKLLGKWKWLDLDISIGVVVGGVHYFLLFYFN